MDSDDTERVKKHTFTILKKFGDFEESTEYDDMAITTLHNVDQEDRGKCNMVLVVSSSLLEQVSLSTALLVACFRGMQSRK